MVGCIIGGVVLLGMGCIIIRGLYFWQVILLVLVSITGGGKNHLRV